MTVATYEKVVSGTRDLCKLEKKILYISMNLSDVEILNQNFTNGNIKVLEIPVPCNDDSLRYTNREVNEIRALEGKDIVYGIEKNIFSNIEGEPPFIIRLIDLL